MTKIAVAVSGGVDSLCALLHLKEEGHSVLAIHGLFLPHATVPPDLEKNCKKVGADFIIADVRRSFSQCVIEYFNAECANGRTPNPCAVCNRNIKFGELLKFALEEGAEKLATGHYGSIDTRTFHTPVLHECSASNKDQTYFLSTIHPEVLGKVLFPLGKQTKLETRILVEAAGLSDSSQYESQDACFLQKDAVNARRFKPGDGPILIRTFKDIHTPLEELPEIGRHNGLGNYTLGQRKGLGIAWKDPLYIREIDYTTNSVVVAQRNLVEINGALLKDMNFFVPPEKWTAPLFSRMRYRQKLVRSNIDFSPAGALVQLQNPCFTTAPGQVCAIYDSIGNILAGGIVEKVFHCDCAEQ